MLEKGMKTEAGSWKLECLGFVLGLGSCVLVLRSLPKASFMKTLFYFVVNLFYKLIFFLHLQIMYQLQIDKLTN